MKNTTTRNYTLKTELQSKTELILTVPAESAGDAVRQAGEIVSAAAGEPVGGALYVGGEILNASFQFEDGFVFGEEMIIGTSEIGGQVKEGSEDLEKAAWFLTGKNYGYQGEERDFALDSNPLFMKPVWTEDGRGTYACFHVTGKFDFEIEKVTFRLKAVLYPTGRSQLSEDGGLSYAVEFKDKQFHITIDELPRALELYEEKFIQLITALRRADPLDGLAVFS